MTLSSLKAIPHEGTSSAPTRREAIARGALEVLGLYGSRGLTHRAIDGHLGLPIGTTSAYYRRREDLVGMAVRALFASDFERFETQMAGVLASGAPLSVDDAAAFFARMVEEVRVHTPEEIKLARYECFLLAHREKETNRLMCELFDARQELDRQIFARLGAPDPLNAAIKFGYSIRGVFMTIAFLPEPAERLDLCDAAYFRSVIEAAVSGSA